MLEEKENDKYLRKLETTTIKQEEMKKKKNLNKRENFLKLSSVFEILSKT